MRKKERDRLKRIEEKIDRDRWIEKNPEGFSVKLGSRLLYIQDYEWRLQVKYANADKIIIKQVLLDTVNGFMQIDHYKMTRSDNNAMQLCVAINKRYEHSIEYKYYTIDGNEVAFRAGTTRKLDYEEEKILYGFVPDSSLKPVNATTEAEVLDQSVTPSPENLAEVATV